MSAVSLIFRKRLSQYNSIEEVFKRIISHFEGQIHFDICEMKHPSNSAGNLLKNIIKVSKYRSAVYHITGDVHYVSLGLTGYKTILTIHDFYSARRGNWFNRLIIRIIWYYLPAWKVRFITVISNYSREELLKIIPFAREKIRVIPNPLMILSGPFLRNLNKEKPCILMVGTKPNKNLEGMLEACKEISCTVKILGKLKEQQVKLLYSYEITYANYYNISYDKVIELYKDCDLLFFASFEEGFGLPILEAQGVGRPVITSNSTAMPDTAGEGACLVDPHSVESMREGLKKVINEDEYREDLLKKGLENLKRFDPERIANMYMDLYKEVAGEEKQKKLKTES